MTETRLQKLTCLLLDMEFELAPSAVAEKLGRIATEMEQSFGGVLSVWGNDLFSDYASYFNCNLSTELKPVKDRNEMMRLIDQDSSSSASAIYIDEVRDNYSKIMIVYSPQTTLDHKAFTVFKKALIVVLQRCLQHQFFDRREQTVKVETDFLMEQLELKVLAEQFFIQFINQEIKSKNQAIHGIAELFRSESSFSDEQSEFLNAIVASTKDLSELHLLLVDWIKLKNDKIIFNGQSIMQQQLLTKIEEQFKMPMKLDLAFNNQYWNVDFSKIHQVLQLINHYADNELLSVTFDERSGKLQINFNIQEKKLQIFQKFYDQEKAFQSVRYQLVDWMRIYCLNKLIKLQNGAMSQSDGQWILEFEFTKAVEPAMLSTKPRSLKGMKLLVAEDLEINKMLLSTMLTEWGIQYEFAKNGLEALLKHKRYDYDAILMDIEMPEMDGRDTTWHIRNNFLGEKTKIPIIGMTADADIDLKELCEKLGMSGIINKPLHKISLYQELARLDQAS